MVTTNKEAPASQKDKKPAAKRETKAAAKDKKATETKKAKESATAEKARSKSAKKSESTDKDTGAGVEKKKRIQKEPNEPKKPTCAFFRYQRDPKNAITDPNITMHNDRIRAMSKIWEGLSDTAKEPQLKTSEEDKANYWKVKDTYDKKQAKEKAKDSKGALAKKGKSVDTKKSKFTEKAKATAKEKKTATKKETKVKAPVKRGVPVKATKSAPKTRKEPAKKATPAKRQKVKEEVKEAPFVPEPQSVEGGAGVEDVDMDQEEEDIREVPAENDVSAPKPLLGELQFNKGNLLSKKSMFDFVPLTVKKPELHTLLVKVLNQGHVIESVLMFFDPQERLWMNFVSKRFYLEHIPVTYMTIPTIKALVMQKLMRGFPQEALEKYCKPECLAKYKILGPAYAEVKAKALDWCPDLSTGDDVEYKDGFSFSDECGWICWGMVLKGTTVKHGFVGYIDSTNGWIKEAHYRNDKIFGYNRSIYISGHHITTCCDTSNVGI